MENDIGGLPYYREQESILVGVDLKELATNVIYSIWEPSIEERTAIAEGANILLGQVGEPIRPVNMSITELIEV